MDNRIIIFSFTRNGTELNRRLNKKFQDRGKRCCGYAAEKYAGEGIAPLPADRSELIGSAWGQAAFVFIGAAGIAVRWTAPWIKDKFTDSPVVVADETGQYVIPLLSSHIGGAAALAEEIAQMTGGQAVHTTATDVQRKFAVDVFAVENGLLISDREAAKQISAAVLEGEQAAVYVSDPGCRIRGRMPDSLILCGSLAETEGYRYRILIGDRAGKIESGVSQSPEGKEPRNAEERATLVLRPKNVTAGIGCRKGISEELLEAGLADILKMNGLETEQVERIASIDLKRKEPGLIRLAEKYRIPFTVYSARELAAIREVTSGSEFVEKIAGVDNVCERAALSACKGGKLVQGKCTRKSMTVALARRPVEIRFL